MGISQKMVFLIPVRQSRYTRLPEWAERYNTVLAHYQSHIKHVNAIYNKHAIFNTDYHGVDFLQAIMHVNAHATNIIIILYYYVNIQIIINKL